MTSKSEIPVTGIQVIGTSGGEKKKNEYMLLVQVTEKKEKELPVTRDGEYDLKCQQFP